ncbi:glycosyl hydrolase family 8 [Clostridium sp.]|uniref:glycosyl hydrolase family 8 n=1 Tax=Clostridium sp. TaxID=1506 RepID=UPI002FC7402F
MKKLKSSTYGILFLVLLVILIGVKIGIPYILPVDSGVVFKDNPPSEREDILLKFIDNKMTDSDGGIKTNYKDTKSEGDITKGHTVLSESEGMMLLYYLERNDKENFNKTLSYIENYMKLKDNLISWRVDGKEEAKTSATIDDLRIVKALLLADERWGGFKYRIKAISISRAINEKLIDEDVISDFYDGYNKSDTTTLCYLDLPTIKYLSNIDYKWKKVYGESNKILQGGYISDNLPLYKKSYNRKTKEYNKEEDVDTLLSLIVILNKAEVSEDVSKSVNFLNKKFETDGAIYAKYDIKTGNKKSDVESTSIYALLTRIGERTGNTELYNKSLEKLKQFQVMDKKSVLYGGFGDTKTLDVYSFDNLNALLAYRKEE